MPYIVNFFVAIGIPLCVAIFFTKGKNRRFCIFLVIGMLMCLLSAYMNSFFGIMLEMSAEDTAIYVTPLCEELMKLLPVLFFLLIFEPVDEDLMITALTVGIGFATLENCCYLLEIVEEDFGYTLVRGLAVGVMHTVCALTAGIGLTVFKRYRRMGIIGAVGIFVTAYSYHAIYNLLVSGGNFWRAMGYCMPLVTVLIIYILYRNGLFRIEHEEIENEGKQQ